MSDKKLVVAYDGSSDSDKALKLAADLSKTIGGNLLVVSVLDLYPLLASEVGDVVAQKEALQRDCEKALETGKQLCDQLGVTMTGTILEGNPAEEIIKYAQQQKAYLIVVGTRGLGGFTRLLLGSVAQSLVTYSTVPVLVAK